MSDMSDGLGLGLSCDLLNFNAIISNSVQSPTDYHFPLNAEQDDSFGTINWSSVNSVKADDINFAQADFNQYETSEDTKYIKATNFNFTDEQIPDDYTIDGIEIIVEVNSFYVEEDTISTINVGSVKGGVIGENYFTIDSNFLLDSMTEMVFGGATDKCGETWEPSDIKASDFGIVITVNNYDDGGRDNTVYINFTKLRIYISE